jgi:hypothetical protein
MYEVDETTGNITLRQGDSGEYTVEGLPNNYLYSAYFAVYDDKRNPVGYEIKKDIEQENARVTFPLTPEFTDYLIVKPNEEVATYFFDVKLSYYDGENIQIEDTLILGDKTSEEKNTITVYPKTVEGGVKNG